MHLAPSAAAAAAALQHMKMKLCAHRESMVQTRGGYGSILKHVLAGALSQIHEIRLAQRREALKTAKRFKCMNREIAIFLIVLAYSFCLQ